MSPIPVLRRPHSALRSTAAAAILLLLAGCTGGSATPGGCATLRGEPHLVAELFFGRHAGGELRVGEAEWDHFAESVLTPRFPEGFTVLDARGQWSDATSGALIREPTKLVQVAVPAATGPETLARLDEVMAEYRRRFDQRSVGLLLRRACGGF